MPIIVTRLCSREYITKQKSLLKELFLMGEIARTWASFFISLGTVYSMRKKTEEVQPEFKHF